MGGFLGFGLILSGIGVDVASFVLGLRRLRGEGPSGVPIIGMFLMAAGCIALHLFGTIDENRFRQALWLCLFAHLLLQFGILFVLHLCLPAIQPSHVDRTQTDAPQGESDAGRSPSSGGE